MKARIVLAVLVAAAVTGAGCWYVRSRGADTLRFAGTLEANDIRVGSLVGGRLDSIFVAEGDSVRAGERLVSFDGSFIEAQIEEQRGQVGQARARLDLVRRGPRSEDVARAKVEFENAESDRQRLSALLDHGVVAPQEYESAATRSASLKETYLALQRGSRPEDIAAAHAGLASAEGRLHYLQHQLDETVVKAPVDGLVQTLDLRRGDLVAPSQAVAVLLDSTPPTVRIYVPETKLGLVRLGQQVELTIDSYPGRVFHGRVVEISSRAEYLPRNVQTLDQRNDQVFGVKVQAERAPELKAGMAVTARLRAESERGTRNGAAAAGTRP